MNTKRKKLTGSTGAKITAFFLLAVCVVTGAVSIFLNVLIYENRFGGRIEMAKEFMRQEVRYDLDLIHSIFFWGDGGNWLKEYFEERNASAQIYVEEMLVFSCYEGEETPYTYTRYGTTSPGKIVRRGDGYEFVREDEGTGENLEYEICLYVDEDFPYQDIYREKAEFAGFVYELQSILPIVSVGSVLLFALLFIFLMCSAGHKNGCDGIASGVLTELPFDVVTAVFGLAAALIAGVGISVASSCSGILCAAVIVAVGSIEAVWCTIYCMELALRLKLGRFWRNTLIYRMLRGMFRAVRWMCCTLFALIRGIPLVMNTVIAFLAVCILELMGILFWGSVELFVVWCVEKLILLPLLLYFALVCKKLQEGSLALSEGNFAYKVDTSKMILDFKEHGENLNSIGVGIAQAVEERMKSERLKTELITNVSHDLKTPLTSIINYAGLIGSEQTENEKISQYAEVLFRQSKRMKKLLEDLVEASKAATGNLEVNLVPCETSVLLSQAVGEYEQRFMEKQLELIVRQPEEPLRILADGRHLWRVFDNLLNNIYKYAQEGSRVYLNVEEKEGQVELVFRNMSKYPLEVSGEELRERFVRGDKSRHLEGNGLGLSIAASLVSLQKGELRIVTDGDLFKVILSFPKFCLTN